MTGSKEELLRFIELQRADYRAGLPDKLARLHELRQLLRDGRECSASLAELERLAHGLHGTGGTFGFRELAEAAQALELAAQALREAGTPPDEAQQEQVALAIARIGRSLPP
jgi:HPt (histidine-containing phosphotransfer) domain-containing protein